MHVCTTKINLVPDLSPRFSQLGDFDDLEEDFPDRDEAADIDDDGSVDWNDVIEARCRSCADERLSRVW